MIGEADEAGLDECMAILTHWNTDHMITIPVMWNGGDGAGGLPPTMYLLLIQAFTGQINKKYSFWIYGRKHQKRDLQQSKMEQVKQRQEAVICARLVIKHKLPSCQ